MILKIIVLLVIFNVCWGQVWLKKEYREGFSVGFIQKKLGGFECQQVACANKLLANR